MLLIKKSNGTYYSVSPNGGTQGAILWQAGGTGQLMIGGTQIKDYATQSEAQAALDKLAEEAADVVELPAP